MKAFDWQVRKKGYIPISGQIVDASLVPAPKQRNTDGEGEVIKAAQKDTSTCWTLKVGGKQRYRRDGTPLPMIAAPVLSYKSHISIDRRHGFIRQSAVTSASAADGRMLRQPVTTDNRSSEVWADSAYRSRKNEKWLASKMLTNRVRHRKPAGKPLGAGRGETDARQSCLQLQSPNLP